MSRFDIETVRVLTPQERAEAMGVVEEVFCREKNWVSDADKEIPTSLREDDRLSFFLCRVDGEPAGIIRLNYDPPLELPKELEVQLEPGIDIATYAAGKRFVEIGRFMIRSRFRRNYKVALRLIRAAVREVVERGYTHFVTDVYDGDPHSPLQFHTRVLGFERIGTHRHGELDANYVRIILVLDIARSYRRLQQRQNRVFREVAAGLEGLLDTLPGARTA
jgi:hypothetical protein